MTDAQPAARRGGVELVRDERHERTAGREAYRSGQYARKLVTGAGEVEASAWGRSVRSRRCSRGPPPALHGAFLPQRAEAGARDQAEGRGAHAEDDPREGIARGMRQKGRGGDGGAGVDEARSGREDGARRVSRDAGLHGIPAGALAPDQDEQ